MSEDYSLTDDMSISDEQYSSIGFYDAIVMGNLEIVRKLIDSINLQSEEMWEHGYTFLCYAIEINTEIAKLLLIKGCKSNNENQEPSNTPLHFAVCNSDIELVQMLLDRDANINAKNTTGDSPLHFAVKHGLIKIIELLLNRGADINIIDNMGLAPLHIAAINKCSKLIELLLKHGACVNSSIFLTQGKTAQSDNKEVSKLLVNNYECAHGRRIFGFSPLHIAAKKGYVQIVRVLLNHGADIESIYTSPNLGRYTALHIASAEGNKEVVKLLVSRGANINAKNDNNLTPLHIAIQCGLETVVKLLLELGADVDAQANGGKTALNFAIETGCSKIVEHVLSYCPDINNMNNTQCLNNIMFITVEIYEKILEYGFTTNYNSINNCQLLHTAVENGYLNIIERYLQFDVDINKLHIFGFSPGTCTLLHNATMYKQEDVVKLLIHYGADVNAKNEMGHTPIFNAIQQRDMKVIKLLLANGANVKDYPELLSMAVSMNFKEIVEVILDQDGIDVNASNEKKLSALHYTALSGFEINLVEMFFVDYNEEISVNGEIAKLLLNKGANINAKAINGATVLHLAVEKKIVKLVEVLLEYNADINAMDDNCRMPLHAAAQEGDVVITKMLLNKGANINARKQNGVTALHIAAKKGFGNVVEVLLKHGSVSACRNDNGMAPLHIAALKGHELIVENILKSGCDIDFTDGYGRTALHIASRRGYKKVVLCLLRNGANVNIRNNANHTPLDCTIADFHSFYHQYKYYTDDDNPYRNYSSCELVENILTKYLIQMKTAGLYISKKNLESIRFTDKLIIFQNNCYMEVRKMKLCKFFNSNVRLYDILTKDIYQLAKYLRNNDIFRVLQQEKYKAIFPIYGAMITNNYEKGRKRAELIDSSIVALNFLSGYQLPIFLIENILRGLNNKSLENLIKAGLTSIPPRDYSRCYD